MAGLANPLVVASHEQRPGLATEPAAALGGGLADEMLFSREVVRDGLCALRAGNLVYRHVLRLRSSATDSSTTSRSDRRAGCDSRAAGGRAVVAWLPQSDLASASASRTLPVVGRLFSPLELYSRLILCLSSFRSMWETSS